MLAGERAERTVQRYREHLNGHVVPEIGRIPIQKLTADHIAALVRTCQEKGLAPWTISGMLTPLGRDRGRRRRRFQTFAGESVKGSYGSKPFPSGGLCTRGHSWASHGRLGAPLAGRLAGRFASALPSSDVPALSRGRGS